MVETVTMMTCGHVAMSTHAQAHDDLPENHPSCVIDLTCSVVYQRPTLEGRMAVCGYSGHGSVPSDWGLAFFEYRGEGSRSAALCTCGYAQIAHEYEPKRVRPDPIKCSVGGYTPRGDLGTDEFYDGCRGWD